MASSTLRPLSIGEILDAGIKVVLRHWKPLTTCIVGLVAPVWVIYVLLLASIDPESLELDSEFSTSTSTSADLETAAIVGLVVTMLLLGVTFLVAFTACFKAVSDAWLGATPEVGRSLRFGLKRSPRVLLLWIVWTLAIVLAAIPCGIPALWLGVLWSVSIPAMLFEQIGPIKALKRSFSLIQGRWWATLGLVMIGYVLVSLLGTVFQGALLAVAELAAGGNVVANAVAQVVGYTISSAITYPYLAAVLTILYFDQRVRKEGFDLQLLAEGLGTVRDPDAPLPAPLIGIDHYTPEQRAAAPYWPPPPGWEPPPVGHQEPQPAPSEWSHPAGWSAPSPPPLWGSEPPREDVPPGPPAWGSEREPEDPLPSYPGSYPTRSTAPPDPPPAPPAPAGDAPEREDDEKPKPDRGRADWLPPEAPRGPGGL